MYVADTNTEVRTIWQFDYDIADGAMPNRRDFVHTSDRGRPYGGRCDVDGCYWSVHLDGGHVTR